MEKVHVLCNHFYERQCLPFLGGSVVGVYGPYVPPWIYYVLPWSEWHSSHSSEVLHTAWAERTLYTQLSK